jgi:hypothetical protein
MIIALCVLGYLLGMGIATGVAKAFDPHENEVPWVLIGIFWPLAIILYPTMLGTNYIANLVKKATPINRLHSLMLVPVGHNDKPSEGDEITFTPPPEKYPS